MRSTDGALDELGLVLLADDREALPPSRIVPLIRRDLAASSAGDVVRAVQARLTTAALRQMDAAAADGASPAAVADAWMTVNLLE